MDSDILILIIAVGASLVSAIVKGTKKKTDNKKDVFIPNDYDSDDPWQNIDRLLEKEDRAVKSQDNVFSTESIKPEIIVQLQPEVAVEEVRVNYDDEKYIAQIMAQREAVLDRKQPKSKKQKVTSGVSAESAKEISINEDITIDNFNLKNAVLYSEILKPKFKDY